MTVPKRLNLPGLPISDKDAGGKDNPKYAYKTITDLFLRIKYWSQKIDATNIIDGTITSTQIDEDFLYDISKEFSVLTNGEPNAPDPNNVGSIDFNVMNAILPASNPAELDETDIIPKLLFDASTAESVSFTFRLPEDYHSGLTVNLEFTNSATTGGVSFDVSVMATGDGDASPYSASYATANNIDATVDGTTNYLNAAQAELTNNDSLSAGDRLLLKIERAVSDSNDTATGDTGLVGVMIQYYKALNTDLIYINGDVIEVETAA